MSSLSLSYYFQKKGRDYPIQRYAIAKERLRNNIIKQQRKIDIQKMENELNTFFYPKPNTQGEKIAQEFLDNIIYNKMNFAPSEAIQYGLSEVPSLTGSAISTETKIGKSYQAGIDAKKKARKYFENLIKDLDKFRIKAYKQYQIIGNSTALNTLNSNWNSMIYEFNAAMQCFEEEYRGNKESTAYVYNTLSNMPLTTAHFEQFFTCVNTILDNLDYADFNYTQLGNFFEYALADFFSPEYMQSIAENGVLNYIRKSSVSGGNRVQMIANAPFEMNITFSLEEKENAKNFLNKVSKSKKISGIDTQIDIINQSRLNDIKQQKTDVTIQMHNGKHINISAKNWNSLYNPNINSKQSGTVEALTINGIAQTFNSTTKVYDFIHMLQDIDKPVSGTGQFTGAEAVAAAKEMAIIGGGVSALMGLSQGATYSANLFIVNDRKEQKIYVADIPTMLLNAFFEENIKSKYYIKPTNDTISFLDETANFAYSLVHNFAMGKKIYNTIMISKLHTRKLSYYFGIK